MKIVRWVPVHGVLLLLVACAMPGKPPLVAKCTAPGSSQGVRPGPALVGLAYGMQSTPIPLDSVQFTDWQTARLVSVQRLEATRTPTGTVRVDARFVSCTGKPVALRIRTRFIGASQSAIEPETAWKLIHVAPRLTADYSELSMRRDAANYLIEISRDAGGQ